MARRARKVSMYTLMALLLLAIIFMVILSVIAYERATREDAQTRVLYNLEARVASRGTQITLFLRDQLDALKGAASSFPADLDAEDAPARLRMARETMRLRWLCCVDGDGLGLRDDGAAVDLSGCACLAAAESGGSVFCDGESDGAPCIFLAVGMGDGDALVGCLDGEALKGELVSNGASVCLLRADGRIIAAAPGSGLEQLAGQNLFSALDMGDNTQADVLESEAGGSVAHTSRGMMLAAWTSLDVGDGWRVITLVPRDTALSQFSFMNDAALQLAIRLGICALALVALVIWVAWAGNRRLRAEKMRLEWSEERYRILAEGSNEIFWEYDVQGDRLVMGENFQRLYGREGSRTIADLLENTHPEERESVERIFNILKGGMSAETHATVDFRVRKGGGGERFAWCRAHMSVLFDTRRRRRWIIGKLTDISQDRLLAERLEQQARTDSLTGLLNRAGLEEALRLRVEGAPAKPCAIVLLDIDDFKDINDFYGHDVGDDVLRTLAAFLRGHFRGTDIVGRLGGDEFMALMEGVDSREKLSQALSRLKQGLSPAACGRSARHLQRRLGAFPRGRRQLRRALQERRRGPLRRQARRQGALHRLRRRRQPLVYAADAGTRRLHRLRHRPGNARIAVCQREDVRPLPHAAPRRKVLPRPDGRRGRPLRGLRCANAAGARARRKRGGRNRGALRRMAARHPLAHPLAGRTRSAAVLLPAGGQARPGGLSAAGPPFGGVFPISGRKLAELAPRIPVRRQKMRREPASVRPRKRPRCERPGVMALKRAVPAGARTPPVVRAHAWALTKNPFDKA